VRVPPTFLGGLSNGFGNVITPEWFNTLGVPIVAGRAFTNRDRAGTQLVAIDNQSLARAFLNGGDPVGRTITLSRGRERPMEIVGLVADSVYSSAREGSPPTVYIPLEQAPVPPQGASLTLNVRSSLTSPSLLTKSIVAAAAAVDRDLTLTVRPLGEQVDASVTQERVTAMLSAFFGALALLLAGLGIYGVTAYTVNRRRTELGIRVALGAAPADVMRLVLSRVVLVVSIGVVVGVVLSLWASRFVASMLYGLDGRDPATLAASAAALGVVGVAAGWLPAWRASRIAPAIVLRDE
jgi:ABC-type antimicrobial peptide transport system permease subunit